MNDKQNTPPLPPLPGYAPPPLPGKRKTMIPAGVAAGMSALLTLVAFGVGVLAGSGGDGTDDKPVKEPAVERTTEVPAAVEETGPDYATLTEDAVSVELKVKEKQCFGSAGCNMTVEPEFTFDGYTADLDPAATYEITYEIHGDESGPVIETAELTGQDSVSFDSTYVSTTSSSVKLTAEVTDVEEY